jgi:hypothetical protein
MTEFTNDHPESKFVDSEAALGGADAVEKTTYVVGNGTDPNAVSPVGEPAEVGRRSVTPIVWAIVAVLAVVLVVYAFGVFRR